MAIPRLGMRQRAVFSRRSHLTVALALAASTVVLGIAPSALAQSRDRSVPAAPAGLVPASWWNRTTMRGGASSPSRAYAIRSDLSDAETKEFARHLDLMFVEYQKRLAGLEQRAPHQLDVYIFARRQDYLDTLRAQFGVDGTGSGGMFFVTPRGAGLAFFVEGVPRSQVYHVMQHEGFHQVAFSRFGNDLPPWVNEGLAEFFGEAVVVGDDAIIGQSSARTLAALRTALEAGSTISFVEMLTMTPQSWNGRVQSGNAALQYQQAWSMVHFLVYGENGRYRSAFEQYLRLLNNGVLSVEAFKKAFGTTDLTQFEERWKSYAREAEPGAMVTAVERLQFLAEGLLALRRDGKSPKDIAELRTMLEEAKFSFTVDHHGHRVKISAQDPGVFEIPDDEHAKSPPSFVMEPVKPGRRTLKERKLEEQDPTPPTLGTKGLRPRELVVRWKRNAAGDGWSYELDGK